MAGEFAYGNTRLRARRSRLLTSADYRALLGRDLDVLLGALDVELEGPEVASALVRFHGVRRLHEALRTRLARSLEEMRRFYHGEARELVDLALAAWDLHNLLALLRGQAMRAGAETTLANIVPIGAFNDALASEVARQSEFAAAVSLLVAWRLPDPVTAAALAQAWPAYERDESLPALEHALVEHHTQRIVAQAKASGEEAQPLLDHIRARLDARNLIVGLRLRAALQRGEIDELPRRADDTPYLSGGRIPPARLHDAIRHPDDEEVARTVMALGAPEPWRGPLEAWTRGGALPALEAALDAARTRSAIGLFSRGDPLGVGIPVAYMAAEENQARNLRVLGDGAARGVPGEVLRTQLVLV